MQCALCSTPSLDEMQRLHPWYQPLSLEMRISIARRSYYAVLDKSCLSEFEALITVLHFAKAVWAEIESLQTQSRGGAMESLMC